MAKRMAIEMEKVRFLALLLCVAVLFSVFPGTDVSAGKVALAGGAGKKEGAADVCRIIKYDRKEKMLSGDIAIAASDSAVEASASALIATKISFDKKYVEEEGEVNLKAEIDYEGGEEIKYEWFAVDKEGQEEELGETGQEYLAKNIKKGINHFRCKVTVDGGTEEVIEAEIVGFAKEISLQVGEAGSINKLVFGEKKGIGVSPVSVQMKESYNKKKFQKKKYKNAYKKCLKWEEGNPDRIKLKSYCECGKLEITMPGQEEGETEVLSVRLDGSLVFPACKFTVNMAKDRKSLTAIFKKVKGSDKIQFAVGKKGKNGKNNRKWTINKKRAQKTHRIGYSQKNRKKIKEKVFFGRVGLQTKFGVKYSEWEKCKG